MNVRRREVRFAEDAFVDLDSIYQLIANRSYHDRAMDFALRLQTYCEELDIASERGQAYDDVRSGLRVVGFENTVTIVFAVSDDYVDILRLFYRGTDWRKELSK